MVRPPTSRMSTMASVITRTLAPACALVLALGACSSKGEASSPATSSVEPATSAAPNSGSGTTTATGAGGGSAATNPAVQGGSLAPLPGETIEHYYQRIGMPDPLAKCYATALNKLGVTDLHQLESNQALGAKATAQFEICAKANPVTNR